MNRLLEFFRSKSADWRDGFWFGGVSWLSAAVVIVVLALALGGCAAFQGSGDPYGYTWTRVADPLPAQVYAVDDATYFHMCGQSIDGDQACAQRDPAGCSIYVRKGWFYADKAIVRHERKHCDGYDHIELWAHDIFTGRDYARLGGLSK